MKKIYWGLGGVIAFLAILALFLNLSGRNASWIPRPDYEVSYRLVPEKVSKSAAITISVPDDSAINAENVSQKVTFTPHINGRWLKDKEVASAAAGIAIAHAASNIQTYYFQPNQTLEEDRHYAVTVSSTNNSLSADFLTVADPEIVSILPSGDEVLPNSKISIVFNRPMVPLSTLDVMTKDDLPITITPATPGKFKWISTHTLQFIPEKELISSADYSVSVNEGLKSMEGLPVKPQKTSFTTYHLRYSSTPSDNRLANNIIRGYNQPFLIHFNQPIDLTRTANTITITDGGKNVPFTAAYWKTKKSEKSNNDFFGSVYKLLNTADTSAAKETEIIDETMLAIYPEGGVQGNWQPKHSYLVMVAGAFPKSGGDIVINQTAMFNFTVDDIVSNITAISPRSSQTSVDQFDPTGKLQVSFYEDINLAKSDINVPGLADMVYGEKCKDDTSSCVKVPDHKKIIISFKSNSFKPGDHILVRLNKIIADNDRQLNADPEDINLSVYSPLSIYKVVSNQYLNTIVICSSNPFPSGKKAEQAQQKITLSPDVKLTSWNYSDLVVVSMYTTYICDPGQYETHVSADLLPSTLNTAVQ
jgi:hypothetical protein